MSLAGYGSGVPPDAGTIHSYMREEIAAMGYLACLVTSSAGRLSDAGLSSRTACLKDRIPSPRLLPGEVS